MTLRLTLSVVEVLALVLVLAYFLNRIARLLNRISASLAKITFGVRAVETQCAAIGPAADRINANLLEAATGLDAGVGLAERLAR